MGRKVKITTTIDEELKKKIAEKGYNYNELIELGYMVKESENAKKKIEVEATIVSKDEKEEELLKAIGKWILNRISEVHWFINLLLKKDFETIVNLYCYYNGIELTNEEKQEIAKKLRELYSRCGLIWVNLKEGNNNKA